MAGPIKQLLKRCLAKGFEWGQRLGFDVLPRHFYSEIPHIAQLRRSQDWRRPLSLAEVAGADDLDTQLEFVGQHVSPEVAQKLASQDVHREASLQNGETTFEKYGKIEAQMLYAFVRSSRPSRIVQVGCGVSTAISLMAAEDAGYQPTIVCIEPYPSNAMREWAAAGKIELIAKPVQALPLEFLESLGEGDLFFVDSTHTLGPAGEVTRIITDMLPRVRPGVLVHFHDIWLPYDYAPTLLSRPLFFWHETALLAAFLSGNTGYRILASLSQLHHGRQLQLADMFPTYHPAKMQDGLVVEPGDFPSSIYLLRC